MNTQEPLVLENLEDLSYDDLSEIHNKVAAEMDAKRTEARANAMEQVVSLIKMFEITGDELNEKLGLGQTSPRKRGRPAGSTNVSGNASVIKKKVAPKYRNPENSEQTWTGRGVAPVWIRDHADRTPFLIPQEASQTGSLLASQAGSTPAEPEAEPEAETTSEAPTARIGFGGNAA